MVRAAIVLRLFLTLGPWRHITQKPALDCRQVVRRLVWDHDVDAGLSEAIAAHMADHRRLGDHSAELVAALSML